MLVGKIEAYAREHAHLKNIPSRALCVWLVEAELSQAADRSTAAAAAQELIRLSYATN